MKTLSKFYDAFGSFPLTVAMFLAWQSSKCGFKLLISWSSLPSWSFIADAVFCLVSSVPYWLFFLLHWSRARTEACLLSSILAANECRNR